jgi:hypothetical protein
VQAGLAVAEAGIAKTDGANLLTISQLIFPSAIFIPRHARKSQGQKILF